MDGFKLSIELPMPMSSPNQDRVELCDECHMKHAGEDECWTGMLPSGELPLPPRTSALTGRELIDEGMPMKVAKNVKVIKKGKQRGT